jgi:SAM-dependent methyltransferase
MKIEKCPLCESYLISELDERHKDGEIEYVLWECRDCGVQFWSPFKNPGAEWYEKDKRYSSRNASPELKPGRNQKYVIEFLRPLRGKVLDAGCGTGTFLNWAKSNGWTGSGFDFDDHAIKVAKDFFRLENVERNDLSGYYKGHNNEEFDLITLFDVFEHIDDHNEIFEIIKKMLNKNGCIAMTMPYRRHARWLNSQDLPPRHLTRWDRRSLRRFLEDHGFDILCLERQSEGIGHILMRLRFRYGKIFSFGAVNRLRERGNKLAPANGKTAESAKIKIVFRLARIKDWLLFGIPALVVWFFTLPFPSRYVTLFVIARKK